MGLFQNPCNVFKFLPISSIQLSFLGKVNQNKYDILVGLVNSFILIPIMWYSKKDFWYKIEQTDRISFSREKLL